MASCQPPAVYLQEVPEPPFRAVTNADLVSHVLDLRQALGQSNADKRALRAWAESQSKAGPE
jgi:hypothetical protein